jgi:hypothetical protein
MRALVATLVLVAASACGGLENEPLTLGIVRGSLLGASAKTSVSIFHQTQLSAVVDATGAFELRGVPQGEVEVLALISTTHAERIKVSVQGGGVTDVGVRAGRPVSTLELELQPPSFQRVDRGTVVVEGTPLSLKLEEPGEWVFYTPEGCYQVTATVPGLGSKTTQICATESVQHEVHLAFPPPNGSPGREGCRVSGCLVGLECHADGACGL